MEQLHLVLAWLAVFGGISLVLVAALTAMGRTRSYLLLDRAIIAQLGTFAAAMVTGLLVLPIHGAPTDSLHFVYAVVGLVVAPTARYATRNAQAQRMGRWQLVAGVVALGVVLRLFMTGR